jgi:uncharacterized protein (DUF2267 family)
MSAPELDVFDTTIHKTNRWLNEVSQALDSPGKHIAYLALRATLHALRDRLTVQEVVQLGAQFPMLIRGFYYEGWDPTGKPLKIRHKDQFLARIQQEFPGDNSIEPERIARAVFTVLAQRISEREIADIKHVLPSEIRELWP